MLLQSASNENPTHRLLNYQLTKLQTIDNLHLAGRDFFYGYVAAYIYSNEQKDENTNWKKLYDIITNAYDAAQEKVITPDNLLKLILVGVKSGIDSGRGKRAGIEGRKIGNFIEQTINNLAIDEKYLNRAYFDAPNIMEEQDYIVPSSIIKGTSNLGLECPICCEQITLKTVCPIECGHNLHKKCFVEHFRSKVEVKKFPVLCPEEGCNQEIVISDIQQYITGDILEKYYQFSLHEFVNTNKKNTNWCPTAGCSAIFEFDGVLEIYSCPTCKKEYCLKCRLQSHLGKSCEQNRALLNLPPEQKLFMEHAKNANYKQCPSCLFWVEKNHGCDHMTCRCGYQFCFRCSAPHGTCHCDQNDSYYGNGSEEDDEMDEDVLERLQRHSN